MKGRIRSFLLALALALASPLTLSAHPGHEGGHGWLAGALQPFLGLDHALASTCVALVLALGIRRMVAKRASSGESRACP
jgi:hydrogenase/urease accessory protein HupE